MIFNIQTILFYKLKLKNLGPVAIPLFEDQIRYFYNKKYSFITLKEYYNKSVLEEVV